MVQSTGDAAAAGLMPGAADRTAKQEPARKKPESYAKHELAGIKFDKKGNANCNFVFASKQSDFRKFLLPVVKDHGMAGQMQVVAPMVICEFRAGTFILDDKFRTCYDSLKRPLNDITILKMLIQPAGGYRSDYWFVTTATKPEAAQLRRLQDGSVAPQAVDPLTALVRDADVE